MAELVAEVVKDTEEEKGVEESLGRAQEQVPERYSSVHIIAEDPCIGGPGVRINGNKFHG